MLLLHVGQRIQEVRETTAAACGFRDAGSDGRGHGASPAACEPQIANRGRRPVIAARFSVHVPTVISTALCGRGHKRFALKAVPKI